MTGLRLVPNPDAPTPARLGDLDDEALMALVVAGHRPAFETLARRHLPRVARYCAKFLGDGPAGEEVAQEVFLEAWRQRTRYASRGRLLVWLLTGARNRCRNRRRDEGRRRAAGDRLAAMPGEEEALDQPLEVLLTQERARRLRAALPSLPPRLREALLLRYDQGLEYGEVARVQGAPEGTIRSRVFHALRTLRDALSEEVP